MKNTLAILITLATLNLLAGLQSIDLATPHTNTVSTSGYLTVPGYFTNAPYFAYNFTNISYGEPSASALVKMSNNIAYCEWQITNGITFYPSNQWNLNYITNQMANMSHAFVNSNGVSMVDISISNGVVTVTNLP